MDLVSKMGAIKQKIMLLQKEVSKKECELQSLKKIVADLKKANMELLDENRYYKGIYSKMTA